MLDEQHSATPSGEKVILALKWCWLDLLGCTEVQMRNKFVSQYCWAQEVFWGTKDISKLNQSAPTVCLHGDIDNIILVFFGTCFLSLGPNTPRTGLTFISQDVELVIWFLAQSTAAQALGQARMRWECVVRSYGRAELDGMSWALISLDHTPLIWSEREMWILPWELCLWSGVRWFS